MPLCTIPNTSHSSAFWGQDCTNFRAEIPSRIMSWQSQSSGVRWQDSTKPTKKSASKGSLRFRACWIGRLPIARRWDPWTSVELMEVQGSGSWISKNHREFHLRSFNDLFPGSFLGFASQSVTFLGSCGLVNKWICLSMWGTATVALLNLLKKGFLGPQLIDFH